MHATEARSFEETIAYLPEVKHRAEAVLRRLQRIAPLPDCARVVDVGSAQGGFLIACAGLGYVAVGIEPWPAARATSRELGKRMGVQLRILDGIAESLPLESEAYDIVHANAVIEHVDDVRAAFREAFRVLKSGGVLWFSAANSLCPRQMEISGFPAFGWYPDFVKQRTMRWAAAQRPHLVGHTAHPAINWFTPWKARRLLHAAGFSKIYDRWDLRLADEGGRVYQQILRLIKLNAATKFLADVAVMECSYAAVK
jgi:SAM-dependent methyltransferase